MIDCLVTLEADRVALENQGTNYPEDNRTKS